MHITLCLLSMDNHLRGLLRFHRSGSLECLQLKVMLVQATLLMLSPLAISFRLLLPINASLSFLHAQDICKQRVS